jgi:1-deoxy-D-xylulose-5-phosphate reductoisomerase
MKKISILGSTGSIGVNALSVVADNPGVFQIAALAAGKNIGLLKEQIDRFRPALVSVMDENDAHRLYDLAGGGMRTKIVWGEEGVKEVAAYRETDMMISAIVGAAGLVPTMEAIEAGTDVALANKETMVMAGSLVVEKALTKGVKIIPVDSELSAIFQCLSGHDRDEIKRIILTASGGPFLRLPIEKLSQVTVREALNHPNWKMGKKISIDSATLINKGLEIMEASWFFGVDVDRIQVHIHPQSIVHSLVEFRNGSVMAQLGVPDMKGPISYALFYPKTSDGGFPALDLVSVGVLEFLSPDYDKCPGLKLAYEAARKGGTMPVVYNAANEEAVYAFLDGRIKFMDISVLVGDTMSSHQNKPASSIDAVLDADRWARERSRELLDRIRVTP